MVAPNVQAIATRFSANNSVVREVLVKAFPAYKKLVDLLHGRLASSFSVFRGLRLVNPYYVSKASVATISNELLYLLSVPALKKNKASLLAEISAYKQATDGVTADADLHVFWKAQTTALPHFFEAAREAILIQPSSAAAERALSQLDWMFSEKQESSLEDYKKTSVMMRYNRIQRRKPQ